MKYIKFKVISSIISAALLTPITSHASTANKVNNGDFQTADFSSWSRDIDGSGEPGPGGSDFTIDESLAGEYAARIETDYWSTTGDTESTAKDDALFASTLYQALDLTAL